MRRLFKKYSLLLWLGLLLAGGFAANTLVTMTISRELLMQQSAATALPAIAAVLHAEIRTPWDIENEVGLTEGNIFQGELTLDQLLFNRPIPGYAQYRAPVKGLYMCGSSTHPGGGVMGAPGANAARAVLRDLRRLN